MRLFLIDTENISNYNFIDDLDLKKNDTIVMFVSQNSNNISIEDLKKLTESKSNIVYEDVFVGSKNALDFQLITYLSLNISKSKFKEFFIVSNDKGFEIAVKYLKSKNFENVSIIKSGKSLKEDTNKEKIKELYSEINLDDKVINLILESNSLGELHNNLRVKIGAEKGLELYRLLKPKFNQINQ